MEEEEILSYLDSNEKKLYLSLDSISKFAFRYGFLCGRVVQLDKDTKAIDKAEQEGYQEGFKQEIKRIKK